MSDDVRIEIDGAVARIVLDRATKRNALTREMLMALHDAIVRVRDDERVRVVQLRAEGGVFCAGMDLGEMQRRAEADEAAAEWAADARVYRDVLVALFELPMPTLAVVQGPVVAGGVGLVLACDLVVATETAWFRLPEPERGLVAAMVTPLLVHRVGVGGASPLLLGLRTIDASTARATGLCHDVVPAGELDTRAAEWTASILRGSRTALAESKRFLRECTAGDMAERLDAAVVISSAARDTADAREGLTAFLEKRGPRWARESSVDE